MSDAGTTAAADESGLPAPPEAFPGRAAVITGAASGFGFEFARRAARWGMPVVMADIETHALATAAQEIRGLGVPVLDLRVDVSRAADVGRLAEETRQAFGTPALVFNNAGVIAGGLIWEHSAQDWDWVIGVNLMGVAHGVRTFTPLMLQAAQCDPAWRGHIVNTASMAGLVCAPNMGLYNASKHAVVALTETLHHDLSLVTQQLTCSVLCPYFVPTAIHRAERNRPQELSASAAPTRSQRIAQAMSDQAVTRGKVSAAQVADRVFNAIAQRRFYIYSHPHAMGNVRTRLDDVLHGRNPSDPFAERRDVGEKLRRELRGDG